MTAASDADFVPGLEGVIAFHTDIAEPDRAGGSLRYRGVDLVDLVRGGSDAEARQVRRDGVAAPPSGARSEQSGTGSDAEARQVRRDAVAAPPSGARSEQSGTGRARSEQSGTPTFDDVWALLVDDAFGARLPVDVSVPPVRSGDVRVDVQASLPLLAATRGYRPLQDISDDEAREQLAAVTAATLSYVARSARGDQPEVPESVLAGCSTVVERFLTAWLGDPSPEQVRAIDVYWMSAAEHGMNASTFTARVVASTGADVPACFAGAIGSMSGPLHGGAPARVLPMVQEVERTGDAVGLVRGILDRRERLMGFGHRVYRAEDPRARVLRETCAELGAPRYEAALALERAAKAELAERRPDRVIETNVEFWAAVILDFAGVPAPMMPAMFTCARTAGWSAHILEQRRLGRLVRPSALYTGHGPRALSDVTGAEALASRS